MSLVQALCLRLLAALTISALHAEPRCPGNLAGSTLRRIQDDLIVVRVRINRSGPYDFLVDTGSQITTIDPVLASDLHLRIEGTTGVSGVATQSRSTFAFLDLIEVEVIRSAVSHQWFETSRRLRKQILASRDTRRELPSALRSTH